MTFNTIQRISLVFDDATPSCQIERDAEGIKTFVSLIRMKVPIDITNEAISLLSI